MISPPLARPPEAAPRLLNVRALGGEHGKLLAVAAQLGLVLLVIHLFRIEESFGLLRLTPLIFVGFVVHSVLPLRWRLPFFVALSLAGIGVILGFPHSVGLIALGLGLIGLCHLPIAFRARVALVLGAGVLLVALRAQWIETSWSALPTLVLPVLGAMFMFRLAIYLYDLRHETKPASIWERLAYFFMLPNVCFLLFPVVDYQTFRRTYYNTTDEPSIYQKGVLWMYRGVVHLILYRVIYYYLAPAPSEVEALGGVIQSVLTTYLLYLRISGQFHLIIGIMCLFGFNLPETHHLYFLASSFNDYWRRVNIYWKDFMMKLFYFPSVMPLRRFGMTAALAGSTMIVFVGTWALHSYQWFWLRGTFPITLPDLIFWGILGVFVVVNSLHEVKQGRKRSLTQDEQWRFRDALVYSAKVVGMFSLLAVLWSLWSSPTVGDWVALMAKAGNSGVFSFALLGLALVGFILLGVLVQYLIARGWSFTLEGRNRSFARSAWATSLGALALLALGQTQVQAQLGERTSEVLASLQQEQLNRHDEELMERGYYEGLLNAESYTSALWTVQAGKPKGWEPLIETEAVQTTEDVLLYELRPSYNGALKDAPFVTNQWGMHDQEYTQEKPPGTFRIALLGSSYAMGSGVEADQTFEAVLEERLNREHAGAPYDRYEILNFSVGGYSVLHNVALARERMAAFDPDLVFFIVHSTEDRRLERHLMRLIQAEQTVPYDLVRERLEQAGLAADAARADLSQQLAPHLDPILRWSFEEIAAAAQEQGRAPVWIYVPSTDELHGIEQAQFDHLAGLAQETGFTVLNLQGAYQGYDREAVRLADWDQHLNVTGHRLVAERLYEELLAQEQRLGLGLSAQP